MPFKSFTFHGQVFHKWLTDKAGKKKIMSDNYAFLFCGQNFIVSIFMEMEMGLFGNKLNNEIMLKAHWFLKRKAEVQYSVCEVSRLSQP